MHSIWGKGGPAFHRVRLDVLSDDFQWIIRYLSPPSLQPLVIGIAYSINQKTAEFIGSPDAASNSLSRATRSNTSAIVFMR